jgi:hypothetical protein
MNKSEKLKLKELIKPSSYNLKSISIIREEYNLEEISEKELIKVLDELRL